MSPDVKQAIDRAVELRADIMIVVRGAAPGGRDWVYVCERGPSPKKQTWWWDAPSLAEGEEARAYVRMHPYALSYVMHAEVRPDRG